MARRAYPILLTEEDFWDPIAVINKHGLHGWWNKEGLADFAEAASFLELTGKDPEPRMGLFVDPSNKKGCPYVIWKMNEGYAVAVSPAYT